MKLFRLASLFTLALLGLSATSSDAAKCNKPRVRRAWTSLSPADRQLYKDAIAAAMDSGAYIKFVEAHTEMMSEMEAHKQCMFIYWHRLFLAAFENMLRDQHPRFACVTVPYWDWLTDYSKFVTNKCTNYVDCAPTVQFLGGRPPINEEQRNITINNVDVLGYCSTAYPLDHFCESSKVSGSKCVRCVPRDDWGNITITATASYPSVRAQLFTSKNIGEMSKAIEEGVHNNVHGDLGGAMGVLQSPADPIFWSHHSMVDLLHSIFHKCKIGEKKMTFTQKATSVDWTSCERRNGGVFNPTDYVVARTGFNGTNPINATQDPIVGKYFAVLPQQYASLVDIRDLGESSYTFEMQGLTHLLYSQCGGPKDTITEPPTTAPVTPAPTTAAPSNNNSAVQNANVTVLPTMGTIANKTLAVSAKEVVNWVTEADKKIMEHGGDPLEEAEQMTCLFQDECLGGVSTFTESFKQQFHVTGDPRCKQIVEKMHRTLDAKKMAEWKAEMTKSFGCPKPKDGSAATFPSGSGSGEDAGYKSIVGQFV